MIVDQWGLTCQQLDEFSLESHAKAARAQDEGRFAGQIVEVANPEGVKITAERGCDAAARWNRWRRSNRRSARTGPSPRATPRRSATVPRRCSSRPPKSGRAGPHADRSRAHRRGRRLGPDHHAHRPDPGDRQGDREERAVDRRHRRLRGQRGLRARSAGVAARDRRRSGATQPQRRRDNGIRYGLQTMCEGGGQANATILELL